MWLARRSIKTVTQFRSQFNLSVSKVAIRQNSSTLINLVEQSNKKFVADILSEKPRRVFTIDESAPLLKAIDSLVTQKLPSLLAVTSSGEISGVFTARDVLRVIHKNQYKDPFQAKVVDVMTKKEKMIFCRSTDSVSKVLNLMYQVKIRNIPVIDKGEVSGIITLKDLADSAFSAEEAGGKKGFMTTTKRKGIPLGTRLSAAYAEKNLSGQGAFNFDMDIASFALPHPYKRPGTVANNRRDYGAAELCTDMSLCEDSHFAIRNTNSGTSGDEHIYLCVADGVGSWRDRGFDPRNFSHFLVDRCRVIVNSIADTSADRLFPLEIIVDAWTAALEAKVVGASTICMATLDRTLNQLSYANIGDCGLMVVRHMDVGKVGYMRDRKSRDTRSTDMRIAYLSQQQLRSFNLPYQLGFADGVKEWNGTFETPGDADMASIPVMPGDIILLATDGLFDNVDLDEIVQEISAWEKTEFPGSSRSSPAPDMTDDIRLPCPQGALRLQNLAKRLVHKARAYSVDTQRDSPFALLAKENDIMWGGGMPDDTSVVVARVFDRGTLSAENGTPPLVL